MIIYCSKCEKAIDTDYDVDFEIDENNNCVCDDCRHETIKNDKLYQNSIKVA